MVVSLEELKGQGSKTAVVLSNYARNIFYNYPKKDKFILNP
ncbi:hypothetical protein SRABI133_04682 [Peribacillus simplex]|uniref:Uncharacterized protein n=1 Tax=Peribacillus simplex TaxID=1478 RepID=A0A9W4L5P2_9BACI|nr:hypothetical protein SRABI133_04682 [Peribacillus simplex]